MEIVPPRDYGDWEAYAALLRQSLGGPPEFWPRFLESVRSDALVLVAVHKRHVLSGAIGLPMPQLFGDQPVSSLALSGVATHPDVRKRGLSTSVIEALMEAGRSEGVAVSPLWPSTSRFYRRLGWEVAGRSASCRVATRALAGLSGSGEAWRDPGEEVREAQRDWARRWNGSLLRPDWWWVARHPEPAPDATFRYGWFQNFRPTGFLAYRQEVVGRETEIVVSEMWGLTSDAWRGLLGLLGSSETMFPTVRFAPHVFPHHHDLLWVLPEQDVTSQSGYNWMLRLVDVPAALEARGWAPGATGRVDLAIDSEEERFVLEVDQGRAAVSPGGEGRVRWGRGALAAWYAGGLSARRAARLGLAAGATDDLDVMDALIDARPAFMPDGF